jgi:hypothetical protein
MTRPRILCAVLPESIDEQRRILEPAYQVTYVITLDEARQALGSADFDLIVCGIHFDSSQMPLLLQHCKNDPRLKDIPFVCVRGYRGRLSESMYQQVRSATALLGGFYVDLAHWIDSRGYEHALRDLGGVIASLLRAGAGTGVSGGGTGSSSSNSNEDSTSASNGGSDSSRTGSDNSPTSNGSPDQ